MWFPQFGDHDLSIVKFEKDDCRCSYKASQLKIIAVADDSQAATNKACAKLNKSGDLL